MTNLFHDIEQYLDTLTEELYKVSLTKEAIAITLAKAKAELAQDMLKVNHSPEDLKKACADLANELSMDVKAEPVRALPHTFKVDDKVRIKGREVEGMGKVMATHDNGWLTVLFESSIPGTLPETLSLYHEKLMHNEEHVKALHVHDLVYIKGHDGVWNVISVDNVQVRAKRPDCMDITITTPENVSKVPYEEQVDMALGMSSNADCDTPTKANVSKSPSNETIKVCSKEPYRFKLGDEVLVKPYQRKGFITHTRSYCIGKANHGMERCERPTMAVETEYTVESPRTPSDTRVWDTWDITCTAKDLELIKAGPLYWVGQKVELVAALINGLTIAVPIGTIGEVKARPGKDNSAYYMVQFPGSYGTCRVLEEELKAYTEPQPKFLQGHYVMVHGHHLVKDGSKGEIVKALDKHTDRYVVKFHCEPYDNTADTITTWCHEHELTLL